MIFRPCQAVFTDNIDHHKNTTKGITCSSIIHNYWGGLDNKHTNTAPYTQHSNRYPSAPSPQSQNKDEIDHFFLFELQENLWTNPKSQFPNCVPKEGFGERGHRYLSIFILFHNNNPVLYWKASSFPTDHTYIPNRHSFCALATKSMRCFYIFL